MNPTPLTSYAHYKFLLNLLERQTLESVEHETVLREQTQQIIVSLRKALAQQKQLESFLEQLHLPYEYHFSPNNLES
jgi:hypothetical protein